MKKKDQYKYFKNGDYIVCIKSGKCELPGLWNKTTPGARLVLNKTYIVDRYLVREDGGIIYDALVLDGFTPLHDGKNFMLLSEFRKMKLKKLKKKLFFKNIFRKFVKTK